MEPGESQEPAGPVGSVLQGMLGPVPRAEFMERHYLKLPFALAGGCRHLAPLGGWDTLVRLLSRPDADRPGRPRGRPAARPAAPLRRRGEGRPRRGVHPGRPPGPQQRRRPGRAGGRLPARVRLPDRRPPLLHPRRGAGPRLALRRGGRVRVADGRQQGVVAPQEHGQPLAPGRRPCRGTCGTSGRSCRACRCLLAEGDWLYIPGGYWHRTQAAEESISLSVGVLSAVALDALDFLRPQLLDSLLWRQRLPTPGEASELSPEERLRQIPRAVRPAGARPGEADGRRGVRPRLPGGAGRHLRPRRRFLRTATSRRPANRSAASTVRAGVCYRPDGNQPGAKS